MTFAIGRRRLTVSFRVEPVRSTKQTIDIPEAIAATDAQLARLGRHAAEIDRLRWESELALLTYRPLA
jgi:hypothetical protein